MICTDCRQRDVCDLAGKDDPLLTGCDASHGTWAFDRLRLDRMTADRDALRAEVEALRHEVELTNEHEHQILTERNEARAELERTKGEMEEAKYDLAKFQRSERVVSEMLIERTLDAENLRRLLAIALPHVQASAGAEHLFDGFRPRERPLDATVEAIRAALERKDGA